MKSVQTVLITFALLLVSCSSQLTTEEYIQSGQELLEKEEWKGAIIELKNAIKESPDNAQARALLGEAYLNVYSSNAAIKELKRAMALGRDDGSLIILLAKAYEQKNENDNIISEIQVKISYDLDVKADIYALRAKAFLRDNKIEEAEKELERAKSIDEKRTEVRLAWARYEINNNNIEAQKKWLKPLLERDGGIADAWSLMAQIEQSTGNIDKAEIAYSKAISQRKIVHLDYIKRALLRIGQKNYDGAKADLAILKNAGASWPMVGHAEGLLAYLQKNYDLAQTQFEKVLSSYPTYTPSQLLLGLTHYDKKNYQSAVTNLELYLATYPENQQANFIYSASLLILGKASSAIPVLEKLEKTYSDNFRVLSLLGNAYMQNKEFDKSINILTKAVAVDPAQAQTRLQLGGALMRDISSPDLAQEQLLKAIEIDPKLFQADLALYMSYMRSKDFTSARSVANKLREKQPDKSTGGNLVALSFLADDKKQLAISELNKTLDLFPFDSLTTNNLARIYIQDNDLPKAKNLYLALLDKTPGDLKSLNQMALISAKEKDPDAVIAWLKQAVDKNQESTSAKLLLASQYLFQNESKLAVQSLQNVIAEDKLQPNYVLIMAKAKMGIGEYQHATRSLKTLLSEKPNLSSAHFLLAQSYAYQNH